MNKKIIMIVVITLLLLGGYALFTRGATNSQIPDDTNQDAKKRISKQASETMATFTSSDKRVQIRYPQNWQLSDTTGQHSGNGQFGPYVQTWTVTNDIQGENGVTVDFAIMLGGQNLVIESLVDCTMKTVTCERVGINSELFIKATTTLNTGIKTIQVATFYDDNVLRGTATIGPGTDMTNNEAAVNTIFNSIQFLNQ